MIVSLRASLDASANRHRRRECELLEERVMLTEHLRSHIDSLAVQLKAAQGLSMCTLQYQTRAHAHTHTHTHTHTHHGCRIISTLWWLFLLYVTEHGLVPTMLPSLLDGMSVPIAPSESDESTRIEMPQTAR